MATDDQSRRSLADDPNFIASLGDLDNGVVDQPAATRLPTPAAPAPRVPPAAAARPAAPVSAGAPRRLIDLFPPAPGDAATPEIILPMAPTSAVPTRRSMPRLDSPLQTALYAPRAAPAPAEGLTYETFYGLLERPFSLVPDPKFLYHSAAHDRAAQTMLDAIRRRDGIAVLTGEMGVGKTMLCRAVMEQLDRRTLTSLVAEPFVRTEELLRTVLVDFGVVSASDAAGGRLARASLPELKTALRDFLYSLAPLQAFAVIIVDEAQKLSIDLLQQVRVLAETGGEEQLLQVMLVGQPSLSVTLSKPELRATFQRVSARATLGPLAADEVAGYVAHRLQMAGGSPRVEFDDSATERLYVLSGGVPRVINLVCDRALAAGRAESASTIDEGFIEKAAEELDLAAPAPKSSTLRMIATSAALVLLVLVGAAAGAFVFRADVAAWLERWQGRPSAPVQPRPAVAPAFTPAPPSDLAPAGEPAPRENPAR